MSETHDFHEDLAYSEAGSDDPLWDAFYHKAFPGLVATAKNDRKDAGQFAGIDRWLCMSSGKTLSVDEKKRRKDYDDIVLEYVSNDRAKTPGWIEKDLAIDYLAYAFMPSRRCYMFPWPALRSSWNRCGKEWIGLAESGAEAKRKSDGKTARFKICKAQNPGYQTLSVAVPTWVLVESVSTSMIVDLGSPVAH